MLGKKVGNKALLWGAIAGTLPDLDVFFPFADPVSAFTYHRSVSHSVFVLTLLTPLLTTLILRIHSATREHRKGWFMLVFLALTTHPLLDCFTVYGTQIGWPLYTTPVTWSTLFIIDPLYTLPLLLGVIGALMMRRKHPRGHWLNALGLLLSTAYLLFTIGVKIHVSSVIRSSLDDQNIQATRYLSTPAPLNTMLWRAIAMEEDGYFQGFYSLFDPEPKMHFERFPSDPTLLDPIRTTASVERLTWFTKGLYSVRSDNEAIILSDLRMGLEPNYVFVFKVGERQGETIAATPPQQLPQSFPASDALIQVWQRIWDPSVQASP